MWQLVVGFGRVYLITLMTYSFVTFVLAVLFLGESFTANRLVGTLLLAGGVYFISK